MSLHLQATITVLSLMNPVICGMIFADSQSSGQTQGQRMVAATKAAIAILLILVVAALGGARVLNLFGISLDIFSVAGGCILVWMGFTMLRRASAGSATKSQDSDHNDSLTPLILFAASPGTITGVITLAVAHSRSSLPVTAIIAVAVATLITWVLMLLVAQKDGSDRKPGLVQSITQCFMGLIVMAMGMQLGVTGLVTFIKKASFN